MSDADQSLKQTNTIGQYQEQAQARAAQIADHNLSQSVDFNTKYEPPTNVFHRIDDWIWHDGNHELFEKQANKGGLIKNGKVILGIRTFLLMLTIFHISLHAYNQDTAKMLIYFTVWGWLLQVSTTVMAQFMNPMYLGKPGLLGVKSKYFCIRVWKWYTILFQFSFVMEVLICPVFWTLLWPYVREMPKVMDHPSVLLMQCLDHSLPWAILITEWCINSIVFSRRCLVLLVIFSYTYMLVNMLAKLTLGLTAYPFMSWDSFVSWVVVPLGLTAYVLFMYWIIEILTFIKLRKLGEIEIISVVKGNSQGTDKQQTLVDPNEGANTVL